MEVTDKAVLGAIRAFVASNRGAEAELIEPETKLLEEGWIDSFALIELIGSLGAALTMTIPEGALIPEDFESPAVLTARLREL